MINIRNIHINKIEPLLSPEMVMHKLPSNETLANHIADSRKTIGDILQGRDKRFLAIVGPCSVHDKISANEYAKKLKKLADELKNDVYLVMRVYFEKPRTTIGWKGLINDPHLNNSFAINEGLLLARELLVELNTQGVAVATEFVDTITPQYIADLVSWAAIGARTTESQPHRTLASGLSMPVGFKNNTSGDVDVAINAVLAAKNPHCFLSVTEQGLAAIIDTKGNHDCHIVLRGGTNGVNYRREDIQPIEKTLREKKLQEKIIIDCSHANCDKDYKKQVNVVDDICHQIQQGNQSIAGIMLESHLKAGRQDLKPGIPLEYGKSITDACIDWEETEKVLRRLAVVLKGR